MNKITNFLRKENFFYTKLLIFICLIYFPIFLNLGGLYMMIWDEARYACSSLEMLHSYNPFVVTFNHVPDLDSTKPPLLHWLQAISFALFGFTETSARLPSAIAGLIICIAFVFFTKRQFNSFSIGAITSFILVTSEGFIGYDHSVRTADYDALLTLFSLVGILSFFLYNQSTDKTKYLFLSFIFFFFAVLTKGVAGLFYLPGLFIYTIIQKNLLTLLKNKWFYVSLGIFIVLVGLILGIREYFSPGYLKALNEMEILGRHSNALHNHDGSWWYYLYHLVYVRFTYWCFLVPIGWIIGLLQKDKLIKSFSLFSLILTVSFYILISSAQSKLHWYELPLEPLLALQAALAIGISCKYIAGIISAKFKNKKIVVYSFSLLLIFAIPYAKSVSNASERDFDEGFQNFGSIQNYLKLERDIVRNSIVIGGDDRINACPHHLFYCYKLNEKGFNLKFQKVVTVFSPGEKVIIAAKESQEIIENNYHVVLLDEFRLVKVYRINGRKISN